MARSPRNRCGRCSVWSRTRPSRTKKRQRDYTYIDREVQHDLDGKGKTKSTEVKTYEILEIYGEQVQRLIEKDDKPLDAKDAAKEEEKIREGWGYHTSARTNPRKTRRKREEKEVKEREDGRKFVREVADAYDLSKLVGTEEVGGRAAWVIGRRTPARV